MKVEIWSDVVCPWCYIGKRRFEAAVARAGADVEITWRAYQLDPTAPIGRATPVAEAYARKFGGPEQAERIIRHVTGIAAESGIEFRMDRALRANTLDAHRLIAWAEGHGRQSDMKQRLLEAYFTDGLDVGDRDTLARLAGEIGLDAEAAARFLDGTEGVDQVRADLEGAASMDITAVPTFVFEGQWMVPGAQDVEVFERVLARVAQMSADAAESDAAAACSGEACEI